MKLVKSIDEYKLAAINDSGDIPVIENRIITECKCKEYEKYHIPNRDKTPVDHIIFISTEIEFLEHSMDKIYTGYDWGHMSDYGSKRLRGKIIVVGLYRDFTSIVDRKINMLCNKTALITYLIGDDIAALSYQIMKQGYTTNCNENLFVFGNLLSTSEIKFANILKQYGFNVITHKEYKNEELPEIIKKRYKTILFFSHGKDDHINIGEYTICGRHYCNSDSSEGPACHYTGKCFKSEDKIISAFDLMAENLIFASCHSGVYYDEAHYGSEYNLMLSAVYSEARTITFAVSGSRFDYKEICSLLSENDAVCPAETINNSLKDIMNTPVYRSIGNMSGSLFGVENDSICPAYDEANVKAILATCRKFIEYDFLPENEEFVQKVFKLYRDSLKSFGRTQVYLPDIGYKEKLLYQKIHELDKELANYISQNYYAACDMSSYLLNNMSIVEDCQAEYRMSEGPIVCHFEYNDIQYADIKEVFSYRSANECFSFGDCRINIGDFSYNQVTRQIKLRATVYAKSNTNCFYGIGFPGYLQDYLLDANMSHEIETNSEGYYNIDMVISLKEESPKQAHYCGFYFIQNMKIFHHKLVFSIGME